MATSSPLPNPEPQETHLSEGGSPETSFPAPVHNKPFVIAGRGTGTGGKDNTTKMLLILGAVVVLVLLFFGLVSTKGGRKGGVAAGAAGAPNLGRIASTPVAPGALVPQDGIAAVQGDSKGGTLEAGDIMKTRGNPTLRPDSAANAAAASNSPPAVAGGRSLAGNKTLNDIPPFRTPGQNNGIPQQWTPPAYSGEGADPASQGTNGNAAAAPNIKADEEYTRPSMVFVAHESNNGAKLGAQLTAEPDNFGLQSGYHVAARLETMASTGLHAPVTAVIEYNYDRDGQMLIPAGARAVGRISQADASGIVNIVFESLELPGGRTVPISAIGASTSLQAIKGNVTGKNAGRTLAVRALAGMGSTAAMMVGQSNVNGAISQGDLIRQRAADNIGSGADTQVMNMQLTEHIVVSVPAATEIYLVFTKSQKVSASAPQTIEVGQAGP